MSSPIVKTTIQAGALSALSNILAHIITCYQTNFPCTLNIISLFQFVTFSVLTCPPNYIWQAYLEAQFPGYAKELSHSEKELLVDDAVSGHGTGAAGKANGSISSHHGTKEKATTEKSGGAAAGGNAGKLSIKNTAIKFTLDQTVGAGVNTVIFIAGIALLRGESWPTIYRSVQEQFWPMIFAGQKIWPAVSILSFSVVPLEHRMLFGSVAGLFWGVYLSLVAGSGKA